MRCYLASNLCNHMLKNSFLIKAVCLFSKFTAMILPDSNILH
uniref:Uncharacterized protein n=1 Tax=Arundo donax TaxID=35708 RepID=A0A0A8YAT1_ARUDO